MIRYMQLCEDAATRGQGRFDAYNSIEYHELSAYEQRRHGSAEDAALKIDKLFFDNTEAQVYMNQNLPTNQLFM